MDIDHISFGVSNVNKSAKFYDPVLRTLGIHRSYEIAEEAIAYGKNHQFWICLPENQTLPNPNGNGVHIAFRAKSKEAVDDFYHVALESGGQDCGKPGPRLEYAEEYYAAFIMDIDGNKIEAVYNPDPNPNEK